MAHFHINTVSSKRNMLKEEHVSKSRGALGTGFTYAPVLLFELYLAINNSSTSHCFRIALRGGRILPLYESLLFRATGVSSTSHYSPFGILMLYDLLLRATGISSTSHYSSSRETSAPRIITPRALPGDNYQLYKSLSKQEDLCSTSYDS